MNDNQVARYKMHNKVLDLCKKYESVIDKVPAFKSGVTQLQAIQAELDIQGGIQAAQTTGAKAEKTDFREEYAQELIDIAGAVFSFAHDTNAIQLKEEVNYSLSDLLRLNQFDFKAAANIITDHATANLASLINYGIDKPDMDTLSILKTKYEAVENLPANKRVEKGTATKNITPLFTQAKDILTNILDKLITRYRKLSPEFVAAYPIARRKDDPKTTPKPPVPTPPNP